MGKGQQDERETAKELSLWFSHNQRSDLIWRTAGSGARATVRAKGKRKTAYQYGDLTFIDPVAKPLFDLFLWELKRGYSKEIDTLAFVDSLTNKKEPILLRWWLKAEKERKLADRKYSILIFKRDRHEKCIMMSAELFVRLESLNGSYINPIVTICTINNPTLFIISFDLFKQWCTPESIYLLCEFLGIECIVPEQKKPKLIKR